jgi:hypothetical protein
MKNSSIVVWVWFLAFLFSWVVFTITWFFSWLILPFQQFATTSAVYICYNWLLIIDIIEMIIDIIEMIIDNIEMIIDIIEIVLNIQIDNQLVIDLLF